MFLCLIFEDKIACVLFRLQRYANVLEIKKFSQLIFWENFKNRNYQIFIR